MVTIATIRQVDRALAARYGRKRWAGPGDPLCGLIRTILSQNTTAANSRAAFASLIQHFPTWDLAARASTAQIAAAIHHGGLARQKAAWIRDILQRIQTERGRLSLDFLAQMDPSAAMDYLRSFRGVGPKTAACVLLFELGVPVFPVDTHVFRVAGRLGWLPQAATPDSAHAILGKLVPPEACYQLHLNMVAHGRELCRPTRPRCSLCPLQRWCIQRGAGRREPNGDGAQPRICVARAGGDKP